MDTDSEPAARKESGKMFASGPKTINQIGGQVNIVGQRAGKSFPEEMLYTPAFESWVGYSWVEDGAGKVT